MPSSGVQTCARSEEHTSELQSLTNLVCRLLLEKKDDSPAGSYHEYFFLFHSVEERARFIAPALKREYLFLFKNIFLKRRQKYFYWCPLAKRALDSNFSAMQINNGFTNGKPKAAP